MFEVEFVYERETKNTYRYSETGDRSSHVIGVLYVKKTAFRNGPPARIKVVVEDVD